MLGVLGTEARRNYFSTIRTGVTQERAGVKKSRELLKSYQWKSDANTHGLLSVKT